MEKIKKKVIPGWTGRCYEDFEVGEIYRSRFGRTVTTADNQLFTHLTLNTNPLHFDEEYARRTRWGKILVNSTFTLALVVGMSVPDVERAGIPSGGVRLLAIIESARGLVQAPAIASVTPRLVGLMFGAGLHWENTTSRFWANISDIQYQRLRTPKRRCYIKK